MFLKLSVTVLIILLHVAQTLCSPLSWHSVFFDVRKPVRPSCSYPELIHNGHCWPQTVVEDVQLSYVSNKERLDLLEQVRDMFYFGYDNYMRHAFPMDELNPIYCSGRGSDRIKPDNINVNDALGDYMLSLVDSLDTLAVMGDIAEFKDAVEKVIKNLTFSDRTVQVFESTIRVMGGLLSAHILMTHPDRVKLYGADFRPSDYDNELLSLARELGVRLLPAFEKAPLGIPWPRVNLSHGVPANCSEETATAGAATLLLEFGVLSKLTGDPIFELVAKRAMRQIYKLKYPKTGLLGSVVNVNTGSFTNVMSGVGAGLDSLYEYLLKAHILFSTSYKNSEFGKMYETLMSSVRQHLRVGRPRCTQGYGTTPIYVNVDMRTAEMTNNWIDSLQAAFPAVLTLNGEIQEAICQHAIFATIWRRFGVLPERFNFRLKAPDVSFYPLRPEFAESTYFLYQATKNPYYLAVGRLIVNNLNSFCKAKCGYATIHDVETMELEDRQESFFLSETVKYLYLLFDLDHPLNKEAERIIFTTEGHIIPIGQWVRVTVDDTLSNSRKLRSKKKSPRRWLMSDFGNASLRNDSGNLSTTEAGTNFVVNKLAASGTISSRSCEMVNNLRYQIAPLDLRFLQQIDAEIGLEKQ